ncbi:MAG: sulfur globule protein CV3 [Candidatus Sedimenticola sp. (ex Thyasira tokunagai)]
MKKTRNFLTAALIAGATLIIPLSAEAFWGGFPFGGWDPWDSWNGPGYGYGYPGYGYGYPGYGYGGYPGYGGYGYPTHGYGGYSGYGYPGYGYGYPAYAAPQPAAPAPKTD